MPIILDLDSGSVGTDLSGLRAKLRARGFDDYDNGRCDYLINTAYLEICDLEDWSFLENDATGAPPLTITDLRKVDSVRITGTSVWLPRIDHANLVRRNLDPTLTGTPQVYYIGGGGDSVRTYPLGGSLTVRYFKTPAVLSSGASTPVIPERFRDLIVLGAVRLAMMDSSASGDVDVFTREYERRLEVMRQALVFQSREAQTLQVLSPGEDY